MTSDSSNTIKCGSFEGAPATPLGCLRRRAEKLCNQAAEALEMNADDLWERVTTCRYKFTPSDLSNQDARQIVFEFIEAHTALIVTEQDALRQALSINRQ